MRPEALPFTPHWEHQNFRSRLKRCLMSDYLQGINSSLPGKFLGEQWQQVRGHCRHWNYDFLFQEISIKFSEIVCFPRDFSFVLDLTQNQCRSREQQQQSAKEIEESEREYSTLKTDLASEATCVFLPVWPKLEPQPPRLFGGRDGLSISIIKCSENLVLHPLDLKSKN